MNLIRLGTCARSWHSDQSRLEQGRVLIRVRLNNRNINDNNFFINFYLQEPTLSTKRRQNCALHMVKHSVAIEVKFVVRIGTKPIKITLNREFIGGSASREDN